MVSKEERDAYERGQADRDFANNNPVGYLFGGGETPPTDPSERAAFDKGLSGKQLDEDDEDED
jgi:hypothetical protein